MEAEAKEPVEARNMVHMGMGHEPMADPQQLAGGEGVQVAQVEQDRPPAEPEIEINAWILEGTGHEAGLNKPTHRRANGPACPVFPGRS